MPDVLLSNDDVTVLGPPNTVEVLLDIGPTGTATSTTTSHFHYLVGAAELVINSYKPDLHPVK